MYVGPLSKSYHRSRLTGFRGVQWTSINFSVISCLRGYNCRREKWERGSQSRKEVSIILVPLVKQTSSSDRTNDAWVKSRIRGPTQQGHCTLSSRFTESLRCDWYRPETRECVGKS